MAVRSISKNISSILISLTLAVLVWIAAVREQNPPREADYAQTIPIEIIPPPAGLINTTQLPESVRLRLLAPESSWSALTPSKFKASINLSELEAGLNDVPVLVEVSDRRIEIVDQTPGEVTVNLETLESITLPIQVEIIDTPPLGYINRAPVVNPTAVTVSGPRSLVGQADRAVSQVAIRNSKETLQGLQDISIRNRANQTIRGLQIDPPQAEITLPIEQRFGYKDVSVRVRVQGQVAPGYRVSNITVTPPTLTIVGNPEQLNAIGGLVETTPINLDQATESIARTVSLNLPNGVAPVSSEQDNNGPGGVKVTVEITPIEDGITLQRPIVQQGIGPDYWWRALPNRADVFLSGPLTQLQSLRASDVEIIVDLFNLDPGVYKLQPTVFHPEGLRVDAILPDTIEVTIGKTIVRAVIQQGLEPTYSWRITPGQVELHLLGPSAQLQSLGPGDVQVVVELANLEPGFYRFRPLVSVPDGIQVDSITPEAIDVTIQPKIVPTQTVTIPVTATITATPPTTATLNTAKDN